MIHFNTGSISPTISYQRYATQTSVISGKPANAVTGDDVKTILPVYDNQTATIIARLLPSVQKRIEDYSNIDATLRIRLAYWEVPGMNLELPYGTHGEVLSVMRFVDNEWVAYNEYTVMGSDYKVVNMKHVGRPVRITFESGTITNDQINQAILQEIGYQFKNRNDPNQANAESRGGLSVATLNMLSGVFR